MPLIIKDALTPLPDPSFSESKGVVAIGGKISPERLLEAYSKGIFPWPNDKGPLFWWSPDPRFVLFPEHLKVSKSMRPYFNQAKFRVTYDTRFREVITECASLPRPGQNGTWIKPEIIEAYSQAHAEGFAHSVEVWEKGKLVGGLYGISLGAAFFGESMFSKVPNASKFGFISLVNELKKRNFHFIDCQVYTEHLESLGAEEIPRDTFLDLLKKAISFPTLPAPWRF